MNDDRSPDIPIDPMTDRKQQSTGRSEETVSDYELVARSLADSNEFSGLVRRYWDRLFRYVRRISFSTDEDIEDILQETFIKNI